MVNADVAQDSIKHYTRLNMCCSEITAQKPGEFFCEMCQIMRICGMRGGVTWVSPHIQAQQGAADITSPAHPASPHKLLHTSCPSVSPLRLRGAAVPWTAQREAATHSARFSLKLLILMQRHSKTSRFFYLDFFWGRLLTDLCVRTVGQIVRKREREPILLATSCHLNTWKWNHAEL